MEVFCVITDGKDIHGFLDRRRENVGNRTEHLPPVMKSRRELIGKFTIEVEEPRMRGSSILVKDDFGPYFNVIIIIEV